MKKILAVMLLFLVLLACQDIDRMDKPENLISENKMVDVLTELSLLQGARSFNKTLMEEKGIDPYPYLMNKFGIDSVQLLQSSDYYSQNYKQYQRIYDKVKIRLEILMQEYDSIREAEEIIQDSIRRLSESDSLQGAENDSLIQDTLIRELPDPFMIRRGRQFRKDTLR